MGSAARRRITSLGAPFAQTPSHVSRFLEYAMSKQLGFASGVVTALFVVLVGPALAQNPAAAPASGHEHHEMFLNCAKACGDCERMCDSCAAHCAAMLAEGKKEHIVTLKSCQDCADVCVAAAKITARGGPLSATICQACADACDQCAKNCEKFSDDKHMKACAEECRKCEKACKEMIKHAQH
jgi:hypothetical protein